MARFRKAELAVLAHQAARAAESIPKACTAQEGTAVAPARNSGRPGSQSAGREKWNCRTAGDMEQAHSAGGVPIQTVSKCQFATHQIKARSTYQSTWSLHRLPCTDRCLLPATPTSNSLSPLRLMLCQALLQVRCVFDFRLLRRLSASRRSRGRIPSRSLPLLFLLVELSHNALVMRLDDIFRHALHAEDLDIKTRSVRKRIVDGRQLLFVYLAHVHQQS